MSVGTSVKKAGRKIQEAITGEEPRADLLDTLKEEHELVSGLLKQLVESDRTAERKSLVRQIKENLVPHLRAEQKVLYDALIALSDKSANQDGEEGYIEHALADKTLGKLERIENAASAEFAAMAKVLKELVEHHVKEEESNVWSDARNHFPADQRKAMNKAYLVAKKKVSVN